MPYNDKEINYSQIEHAVCLGSFELLLLFVHYEVCLITTHVERYNVNSIKFHKHIVAFPSEKNGHQDHRVFTEPPPPKKKRWGQVSQRKVNLGSEQWLGWAGTKNQFSIQTPVIHTSNLQY